jgi:hypothetical protein
MMSRTRLGLAAFAVAAVLGSTRAGAQCNGDLDLVPVNPPDNIVEFVRRVKVVANNSTDSSFKILFDNMRLSPFAPTGSTTTPYFLFAPIYSTIFSHSNAVCPSAPPSGTPLVGMAAVSPNIQDYPNYQVSGSGKVGAKTSNSTLLPSAQYQVDGLPGLFWRGADMQMNLNGLYLIVDVTRQGTTTDTSGWQCNGTLPAGTYRQWDIGTNVYDSGCQNLLAQGTVSTLAPDPYAQHLGPFDFSTEFFTSSPGLFKLYMDLLMVKVEGDSAWHHLCTWKVASVCGNTNEYGVKLTGSAIEISNDGPANGGPGGFLAPGTTFTIPGCS